MRGNLKITGIRVTFAFDSAQAPVGRFFLKYKWLNTKILFYRTDADPPQADSMTFNAQTFN